MNKHNYRVKKVMNNNIILAYDLNKKSEKIIIGKGIGFGRKEEQKVYIEPDKIQKAFTAEGTKMRREYFRLVEKTDDMTIAVCEKIIGFAEEKLGQLNNYIHIILTDHICFAIERVKNGMKIENPLDEEIRTLYPKEYEVATDAVKMIREFLGVNLGQGEAGFIAMHLNSSRQNIDVKESLKNARVMNEIVRLIQAELQIQIDKSAYEYKRLINHINGTINRVRKGKHVENILLPELNQKFIESFKVVAKVKILIEEEYELEIPKEELGYLTIHIERLRTCKI